MSKQKAFYISSRLLSDTYKTYETVQKGTAAVVFELGIETLNLFSKIGALLVEHFDYEQTVKAEIESIQFRLDADMIELKAEIARIEDDYKDEKRHELRKRECARKMYEELKYVWDSINKYDVEDVDKIADYERETFNILNILYNDIL